MIDFSSFKFISSRHFDKLALVYPSDGTNASFTATANAYNQTFSIAHTAAAQFVPIIKYSCDGGASWYYSGDASWYLHDYGGGYVAYAQNPVLTAKANDSQIVVRWNNGPVSRTVLYKIYGIAKNV